MKFYPWKEKITEKCGVFGIFSQKEEVARLTFFGLLALQHRGEESAGIATSNGKKIFIYRGMGLVNQVFTEEKIKKLKGFIAIGHNRYSTEGLSDIKNAQPLVFSSGVGDFALAYNGNLANFESLKKELFKNGHCLVSTGDTEIIARIIALARGKSFKEKIINGIKRLRGAFALLILTKNYLYAIRDRWGVRPLVLGKINNKGWVVASESAAIRAIGGKAIRELKPGEFLEISKKGVNVFQQIKEKKTGFCIFEYVYFARPDSIMNGQLVHLARLNAGKILAKEKPAKADLVISVPDSGTSAALGFSEESKIPFGEGLIKNRYVGRTFIQPGQRIRKLGVKIKFSPLSKILQGKRIVLVDDSIVRGTTTAKIIRLLKKAGAKEVHLRIASPPFKNICYLGIDVKRYKELIARKMDIEQIRKKLKADSLGYLSLEGLKKAIGKVRCNFCTGCFDGNYPV